MRNKLNLLQSRNKPNLRNRKNKPSLQSRSRRNRRSSNRKRSHRSRSNRRRAKNKTSSNKPKANNSSNMSNRSRLSRMKRRVSSISNSKPMAKRNNHRESTHETVRRIGRDTNTAKVVLVLTTIPGLKKTVGATTTDAESTLTAAIGSMQEHIRRGFTSTMCTSFWERTGYGMQSHTMTLL